MDAWGHNPIVGGGRNDPLAKTGMVDQIFEGLKLVSEKDLFEIVVASRRQMDLSDKSASAEVVIQPPELSREQNRELLRRLDH